MNPAAEKSPPKAGAFLMRIDVMSTKLMAST